MENLAETQWLSQEFTTQQLEDGKESWAQRNRSGIPAGVGGTDRGQIPLALLRNLGLDPKNDEDVLRHFQGSETVDLESGTITQDRGWVGWGSCSRA